jgi:DNA-binding NtrC family response regulator
MKRNEDEAQGNSDTLMSLARTASQVLACSQALARRGLKDLDNFHQSAGKTIFVVDDELAIRELICQMLATRGYSGWDFTCGVEVLTLLESGARCDLLIHDLLNAPMDGMTLLQHVRKRYPALQVIVASAVHDPELQQECLELGAFRFLQEPFDRQQLLDMVSLALEAGVEAGQ